MEDWKKPVFITNMLKLVKYICKYRFVVCITLACNGEHTEAKDLKAGRNPAKEEKASNPAVTLADVFLHSSEY